eukprot:scaffold17883_cov36-Tisochrysis_lutea.AAC.2
MSCPNHGHRFSEGPLSGVLARTQAEADEDLTSGTPCSAHLWVRGRFQRWSTWHTTNQPQLWPPSTTGRPLRTSHPRQVPHRNPSMLSGSDDSWSQRCQPQGG